MTDRHTKPITEVDISKDIIKKCKKYKKINLKDFHVDDDSTKYPKTSLHNLPEDILFSIFNFLNNEDKYMFSVTLHPHFIFLTKEELVNAFQYEYEYYIEELRLEGIIDEQNNEIDELYYFGDWEKEIDNNSDCDSNISDYIDLIDQQYDNHDDY